MSLSFVLRCTNREKSDILHFKLSIVFECFILDMLVNRTHTINKHRLEVAVKLLSPQVCNIPWRLNYILVHNVSCVQD